MINLYKAIRAALLKRSNPVAHARSIGVTMGEGCRLIDVSFSSEPYLIKLGHHVSATATRFETHDGGVWVFREDNAEIDVVRPITVGNNVFFGYGTVVLPGVTIGDNVVIGAGSVVTKDIPSGVVAAGVPCRVIRPITEYQARLYRWGESTKSFSKENKREFYMRKFNIIRV